MLPLSDRPLASPIFAGRALELDALTGRLAEARLGRGSVVLVSGEAGIGKTRLLAELRNVAAAQGFVVLQGNCFEPDRALPYAPWLDLLDSFGAASELERTLAGFGRLQPQGRAALLRLAPAFAAGAEPAQAGDAEQEKPRLFRALGDFLIYLTSPEAAPDEGGAGRPLAVILEDLQWSDDTSLEMALHLARRIAAQPVLLLLSYRSDETHPALTHLLAGLDRERLASELSLPRLGRADVARIVQALSPSPQAASPALLDAVYTLTDGNPFFVEEVVQSLLAGGAQDAARPAAELDIPRSVHDAVHRRTARLERPALHALTRAAVIGRRFEIGLLRELTRMEEADLLARLKELVQAHLLVEEAAGRFAFHHELAREAVNATLLRSERRALHRETAEAIERLYRNRLDPRAADLAYHYFRAEAWAPALAFALRAGEQALAQHAPREAVVQFSRALVAARSGLPGSISWPRLYRARGQAYDTVGEFEAARADYEAGLQAARAAGDRRAVWQALLDLGFLWVTRDHARAAAYLREALEAARALDDPAALGRTLNRLGNWEANADQVLAGLRRHHEALALFEQSGDRAGQAETLDLLGMAYMLRGDWRQAAAHYERAVRLLRALEDRRGLASALGALAERGTAFAEELIPSPPALIPEAARDGEAALQIARDIGWRSVEVYLLLVLGRLRSLGGDFDQGLAHIQEALAVASEIGHNAWATWAYQSLGWHYLAWLMPDAAREHIGHGLGVARETGVLTTVRAGAAWLALAHIRAGDPAAAEAALGQAPGFLDLQRAWESRSLPKSVLAERLATLTMRVCFYVYAELALAQGDAARALAAADDWYACALNVAEYGQAGVVYVALARAEALFQLGRLAETGQLLEETLAVAQQREARALLWRIQHALGRCYRAQGRRAAASAQFAAARALAQELSATISDGALREAFTAQAEALLPAPRPPSRRAAERQKFGGLTARERDVALRVAQGLSNRQIAQNLVLSERTVEGHVTNILAKLGLASRTQVAAWAHAHGLLSAGRGPAG